MTKPLLIGFVIGAGIVGMLYEKGERLTISYVELFAGVVMFAALCRAAYLMWRHGPSNFQ